MCEHEERLARRLAMAPATGSKRETTIRFYEVASLQTSLAAMSSA
jgi:hypothetical protein